LSYEDILYDVKGPVATVTLNRPDSLNSISQRLEREMHHAFDVADRDPNVRVIILTGSGRAFSSGYDLSGEGEAKHPPDISVDARPHGRPGGAAHRSGERGRSARAADSSSRGARPPHLDGS